MYNTGAHMGYGVPLSGTVTTETLLPAYNSNLINDSFPPKTTTTTTAAAAMKSDSGLTYNFPTNTNSRKRSRDSMINNSYLSYPTPPGSQQKNCGGTLSFLGEDISLHLQQHQFDIDRLISQHVRINSHFPRKALLSPAIPFLLLLLPSSFFCDVNTKWGVR